MNSRLAFCTLLLSLFSFILFGQPTITITPSSTSPVSIGSTINFDVTVDNYTDIITTQFSISWNPSVLSFTSINSPNSVDFPGLGTTNFGITPANISSGFFGFAWFNPTISPTTVPDGTSIFSFSMLAIGNGISDVEFEGGVSQEVIDINFNDIGFVEGNTSVQVGAAAPVNITLVPTMTEWGLLLFALLMLNLGLIFVYNKNTFLSTKVG